MDEHETRAALVAAATETEALLLSLGADIESILDARRDSSTDDEHDPEGSTLAFERSQADAMRVGATQRLGEIADALARLDAGTYGRCETCAREIAPGRLEARPWTTHCIDHA